MGQQDVEVSADPQALRRFERRLIADVDALERMIAEGRFDAGPRRIGLEHEFFLIDDHGRPAPRALEVLDKLGGPGGVYQTELALFNLELALPPLPLAGASLGTYEAELRRHVGLMRQAAQTAGTEVVAVGILPTLGWEHLTLEYMTPAPRYRALNDSVTRMRRGKFRIEIRGTDSLFATHDNVMLESFNTSFQLHLQVTPEEFPRAYNALQAAAGLTVAISGNSPLLLGHRLWEETRIALFRQSVDTRADHQLRRGHRPRVFFGDDWVHESVLEILRDDVSRFRAVLPMDDGEPDPLAEVAAGRAPALKALCLHNGTIYRWNRPCYGVHEGVPHLRIEHRPIPAGPTALDAIANAAFAYGLALGLMGEYGDVGRRLPFHAAQANFYGAAANGLRASLTWLDGSIRQADELVLLLLPLAAEGLRAAGVDEALASRYLDVIGERASSGQTGARWMIEGFNRLRASVPPDEAQQALVQGYLERQRAGKPVHEWTPVGLPGRTHRHLAFQKVGQIMTTDLVTVQDHDTVTLAEAMMRWEKIRHIPVENDEGRLVGMFSLLDLLAALRDGRQGLDDIVIGDVMSRRLHTVTPDTPTREAIRLLREEGLSALPVVRGDELVGIVTQADILVVAARLLE